VGEPQPLCAGDRGRIQQLFRKAVIGAWTWDVAGSSLILSKPDGSTLVFGAS
jgi:hypothetical protein